MTAPAVEHTIEHLDHQAECEDCGKPADYWYDAHDCHDGLQCKRCLDEDIQRMDVWAADAGIECLVCKRTFDRTHEFFTARPL